MTKSSILGVSLVNWLMALLLFVLLIGWFGYQYFSDQNLGISRVPYDPDCDLRAGPCLMKLDGGASVSFSIEPRTIPVAKTLDLEVNVSGLSVDEITIDINGVDMKMPMNRVALKKTTNGQFRGQGGLMYCTRNAMEWETVLELTTEQGQIQVPYRFITVSDGSYE